MIHIAVSIDLASDGLMIGSGSAVSGLQKENKAPRSPRILLSASFAVPVVAFGVGLVHCPLHRRRTLGTSSESPRAMVERRANRREAAGHRVPNVRLQVALGQVSSPRRRGCLKLRGRGDPPPWKVLRGGPSCFAPIGPDACPPPVTSLGSGAGRPQMTLGAAGQSSSARGGGRGHPASHRL